MNITVNGLDALAGLINEPEQGPWTGWIQVDDEDGAITGPVTIVAGTETFVGTALPGRSRVESGRWIADLVGGANGLQTVLPAKFYDKPTAGTVIADIMTECGEVFDAVNSDPSITTYLMPKWMRARGEARLALQAIALELGAVWRIARSGLVVMVLEDSWLPIEGDYVETDRDPSRATVTIAPDEAPEARPGVTVGSDRVVTAQTVFDGGSLRQILQAHDGTENAQDQATIMADLARRANELAVVYSRWYPAKVIAQDADGTLQILPDDERMRGNGLTGIPLLLGVPGLRATIPPGQQVRLAFEDANPTKPFAALCDQGSPLLELTLEASTQITMVGPLMLYGSATAAYSHVLGDVLQQLLSALTVPTSMGPSGTPINAAQFVQFLSQKHKLDG